jgi:CRP-like cAMP-binding protein
LPDAPTESVRPSPRERRKETAADARGWSDVLAEVSLFAGLSRRHRNKVAALGRIRRFHEGTSIVRAGERGDTFFVLLNGEVSVRRRGLPELSLGIGNFFGELALLGGDVRSATVVAKAPDVVCFTITQSRFLKLLEAEPAIAVALLKELATRLRAVLATV